ncbi:hypothetical protein D3C73_1150920 [compost metagenome]
MIAQDRVLGIKSIENFADFREISGIRFEAEHHIQLLPGFFSAAWRSLQAGAFIQITQNAFEHGIIAGNMRTDKARRIAERHREIFGNHTFLAGIADKGGQVIPDNLSHTGRTERNHLRFIQGDTVLQAINQIAHSAEDSCIFSHGGGHGRCRLLEMAA